MLDSAPVPAAPAPGSTADVQLNGPMSGSAKGALNAELNGQMHVGVRTETFGAVEIHTVVQQSQVGITVHAERDIARWFSSEVPGLESGLNESHLNLTGVNFDHGRSGVQTAAGFSQGQPRQSFAQHSGSQATVPGGSVEGGAVEVVGTLEPANEVDVRPAQLIGSGANRVSIHV
jgi:hypothetical protein